MIFDTHISGIPCQCEVIYYSPYIPAKITGTGFGDAEPPCYGDFIYRILDRKGYPAPWLERKMTDKDEMRIFEEYIKILEEDSFVSWYEETYT